MVCRWCLVLIVIRLAVTIVLRLLLVVLATYNVLMLLLWHAVVVVTVAVVIVIWLSIVRHYRRHWNALSGCPIVVVVRLVAWELIVVMVVVRLRLHRCAIHIIVVDTSRGAVPATSVDVTAHHSSNGAQPDADSDRHDDADDQ